MSTEHDDVTVDETAPAPAGGPTPGAPPEAATPDAEATPEGAAAGADEAAEAEPAPDPLEGKSEQEIRELAAQAGEYLGLAQRTRADFDNYRKRAQRDVGAARVRGSAQLARELLPSIDNIERAIEHESKAIAELPGEAAEAANRLLGALQSVHGEQIAALARGGVERFDPLGEPFDPQRHEAMARRPAEGDEASGVCAVVYEAGYAAGDEIVRPARVVVSD